MIHRFVAQGDPALEPYRDMQERDLVGRRRLLVAEGEVVLRGLLAAAGRGTHVVHSVLVSEKQAIRLDALLQNAPNVLVASNATLEATIGFQLHRGILALAARIDPPTLAELLDMPGPRTLAGLFGISNHDNVGGIFRNLAAFGCDGALLDSASCDPHYRKAIRVSVGGVLRVPFVRTGTDVELVAALAAAGYEILALTPAGATALGAVQPSPRRAILFGAEGSGLAPAVLAQSHGVRLDMAAGFDSLNVATTSGIALYALGAARA